MNWDNLPSGLKGLLMAGAGAALTYLANLSGMEFGQWTPVVVALAGAGLNWLRSMAMPSKGM